jgi:hypothetical protein
MKRIVTIFLMASAVRAADVTLCMTGDVIVDNVVQSTAKYQVARIFSRIGVRLEWVKAMPTAPEGLGIEVRYATGVPGHPGALAFSNPFESRPVITVLYDRILFHTEQGSRSVRAIVLAHVVAHEIGHVLMKTNAHAPDGLMKATWTALDFQRMVYRPLRFLPLDEDAIRRSLAEFEEQRIQRTGAGAAHSSRLFLPHADQTPGTALKR